MSDLLLPRELLSTVSVKTGGVVSLGILWKNAIAAALGSGWSERSIAKWVAAFSSPALFGLFVAEHVRAGESLDESLATVLGDCDAVGVGFAEFVAGMELVLGLLERQRRFAAPSKVEGYVFCSAEFMEQQESAGPLVPFVHEMLDRYGFDG